ncbi:hypothetical protein [uncultured Clostridium sp.]|uniref:hypothetical protein n=1 Tax=uncultured Clostridium sp. TaxID=59620 RepID=UPI0025EDDD79|nr:hypothetical protein [uncultured Clostridium sp.]
MNDWKIPDGAGYKSSWIVIKGSNREEIIKNLKLKDIESISWNEGIEKVGSLNNTVMVSNDYENINFIIGNSLFNLSYNDKLLMDMSKDCKLYYFYTHRVSESHGFAIAEDGIIMRKYYYDEERLESVGLTQLEKDNGWFFAENFDQCFTDDFITINEEYIIEMAEEWTGIDIDKFPYSDVICGKIEEL